MMDTLKTAFLQFAGLSGKQKPNGAALKTATGPPPAAQANVVEEEPAGDTAVKDAPAPVRDAALDRLNLETKIASIRCDLHPLYLLENAAIEILLPNSNVATKTKGWHCAKLSCNRHYVQEFGYFLLRAGENPDFGQMELKSRCATHEPVYMAVAKVDGIFLWACLELGCTNSAPYDEPSPPVLT